MGVKEYYEGQHLGKCYNGMKSIHVSFGNTVHLKERK